MLLQEDIKLGKKLGSGGFGSVYKGELLDEDGSTTAVVVKKVWYGVVWDQQPAELGKERCQTLFYDGSSTERQ